MKWFTGTGNQISFDDIIYQVKEHSFINGTVYIGTDSFFKKRDCIFTTAICLYGADNQKGGRYFFQKSVFKKNTFPDLANRIISEAQKTIELAQIVLDACSWVDLELHLDISSAEKEEKTSKLANMIVGYVKGSGFACKTKPYAFAAASIADKHTKN